MGNCLLRLGRADEAATRFRRLLAMDSDCAEGHHNLGVCCFLLGHFDEGLEHIRRTIELNPKDLAAMHKAILALMHVNRWTEARATIEQALDIDPEDPVLVELRKKFWRLRVRSGMRRAYDASQKAVRSVAARLRGLATSPK